MYETHSPVEDRFGFSTSGTFFCSKQTERISLIIIFGSLIFIAVGWYLVLFDQLKWYFVEKGVQVGTETARTIGYIYIFSMAFIIAGAVIIITNILHGDKYTYSADANRFSFLSEKAHIPKTDIIYTDVVAVRYVEKYMFGRLKGFDVTVITRSLGNITFRYLINKSITDKTPRNTPFNIIEERLDALTANDVNRAR